MQHLLGVTERQNQLLVECRRHLEDFMAEAGAEVEAASPALVQQICGGANSSVNDGPASQGLGNEPDIVLAAEYLRLAALRLAAITGRGDGGDVEDVLGVIFEK